MIVTTFIFWSPKGRCYGNQLIVGAVCRRLHWLRLRFALLFHTELQYLHGTAHVNSGTNAATSCKNMVNTTTVTSKITRVKFAIFATPAQKGTKIGLEFYHW